MGSTLGPTRPAERVISAIKAHQAQDEIISIQQYVLLVRQQMMQKAWMGACCCCLAVAMFSPGRTWSHGGRTWSCGACRLAFRDGGPAAGVNRSLSSGRCCSSAPMSSQSWSCKGGPALHMHQNGTSYRSHLGLARYSDPHLFHCQVRKFFL